MSDNRWPLHIDTIDCQPLCLAYSWTVSDEALLTLYLARLVAGQALAVARVLQTLEVQLPAPPAVSAIDAAIARLGIPANENIRWRRDGWIFQLIAWLATWRRKSADEIVRAPQFRPGEHGIDGLLISLDSTTTQVRGVSICEQKATDNARQKIHAQVWPEIEEYERATRDDQLVAEVTALLEKVDPATATDVACAIHWNSMRWYRVAVTVRSDFASTQLSSLFAGFDGKVAGSVGRRHAEVLPVADLRSWMDKLCGDIISHLSLLKGGL